jgi:hypothetical protein
MNAGTIRYDSEQVLQYSGSSMVTTVTFLTNTVVVETIYYNLICPHHTGLTSAVTEQHT